MSIINQMLKDLDGRHGTMSNTQHIKPMSLRAEAAGGFFRQHRKFSLLISCMFGLCILVIYWSIASKPLLLQPSSRSRANTSMEQMAMQQESVIEKKQSQVTGAEWQTTSADSIRLVINVDEFLKRDVIQNALDTGEIEFKFPSTSIQTGIPIVDLKNTPLQSFRFSQRNDSFFITVKPKLETVITSSIAQHEHGEIKTIWTLNANSREDIKTENVERQQVSRQQVVVSSRSSPAVVKKTTSNSMRVKASYQRALNYLQENHIPKAVTELEAVLKDDVNHKDARELLVNFYQKAGRSTEANMLLMQGIELKPEHLPFRRLYAQSLVNSGDLKQAGMVLENGERLAGSDAEYRAMQAAVAQRLSKHGNAVTHYVRALEIKPQQSEWWAGLAISLEALDERESAQSAYVAALDSGQLNGELRAFVDSRIQDLR